MSTTTIAEQVSSAMTVLGRLFHWRWQGETLAQRAPGSEEKRCDIALSEQRASQEPEAIARGVIRREEVPLLARYGTTYGLFDAWISDYQCVLISDVYELDAYVGDGVWVSGSLTAVIGGMPLMKVTRMELLRLKWMR
jgi:hypothetical protein